MTPEQFRKELMRIIHDGEIADILEFIKRETPVVQFPHEYVEALCGRAMTWKETGKVPDRRRGRDRRRKHRKP